MTPVAIDNLPLLALGAAHSPGAPTFALAAGSGSVIAAQAAIQGLSISPSSPIYFVAIPAANVEGGQVVSASGAIEYLATGLSGDTLTGVSLLYPGTTTDPGFAAGAYVLFAVVSAYFNGLASTVASLAPLASPAFTDAPTAPTPPSSDDSDRLATTAFVKEQGYLATVPVTSVAGRTGNVTLSTADIAGLGSAAAHPASDFLSPTGNGSQLTGITPTQVGALPAGQAIPESQVTGLVAALAAKAPLDSPALTGTPTSTTPATNDNSNRVATTAFVAAAVAAGGGTGGGGGGGGMAVGSPVTGASANGVLYVDPSGNLADTSTFVYTGTKLGVGTASPASLLDIHGSAIGDSVGDQVKFLNVQMQESSGNTDSFSILAKRVTAGTDWVGIEYDLVRLVDGGAVGRIGFASGYGGGVYVGDQSSFNVNGYVFLLNGNTHMFDGSRIGDSVYGETYISFGYDRYSQGITAGQIVVNNQSGDLILQNYGGSGFKFNTNHGGNTPGHLDGSGNLTVTGQVVSGTSTTTARPGGVAAGAMFYDTDLKKPVWYDGSTWRDAMGTAV